jgi:glycosyltransferase involved in cell wall biosynthesis
MGGIWLVLHLDAKKRGTMEQQLIALARRLQRESIPTTMVFARPPAPFPAEPLREAGVEIRHIDFARPPYRVAHELLSWFRTEQPRIVHYHFIDAYSPLVAAGRLAGARVLVHDHLALSRCGRVRGACKGVRSLFLNGLCDERVAVSSFVARTVREFHHVPAARVSVVDNGVDVGRFERAHGERIRNELRLGTAALVVSIARLDDEKGGEWLLRAFARTSTGAHLAMVGEGRRLDAWRTLSTDLGISSRVHFLGLRQDCEEILAAASVAVSPSLCDEGFGLAAVEGMAAGKPVVVTESGPLPEIVGGGGLIVPKRDSLALANAIDRVLTNELLARKLGEHGRARAQALYSMDRYVEQQMSVYRRHLPAASAAPGARARSSRDASDLVSGAA